MAAGGCDSCASVEPNLVPLHAAEQTGGAKKKKKTGAKKGTKKGTKCGGGGSFLGELGQLAIPLGLIAAKEGVEYLQNNNKKKKTTTTKKAAATTATATATGKKKKTSAGKKKKVGGNPEGSLAMDSAAPYPSSVSDGLAATSSSNYASNINTSVSDDSQSTHLGGGQSGGRSAMIAQEFRRMANEISSYLAKRKAEAKRKVKGTKK